MERLFAVLAISNNFAFLSNLEAKYRFRSHIKLDKVNNFVANFKGCVVLNSENEISRANFVQVLLISFSKMSNESYVLFC